MELSDHLFRHESGRMVAALTRVFGIHNLALAEDVVQEAFCRALEVWRFRGVPDNPAAWLMATAKNSALDVLRRERTARTFAPELGRLLESEWTLAPVVAELFHPGTLKDDMLRLMFSCCHPGLREEAQVALVLHILCGFSMSEVANAFVSSTAATEKRIQRAKKVLTRSKKLFDTDATVDFSARLPGVQRALYLLFNEGYHSASAEAAVRRELCQEAMRLTALLLDHKQGRVPATYALAALMCLSTARLPARIDAAGNLSALSDQNRTKWDRELIAEGLRLMELSATGSDISAYHVEAAIAAAHARARDASETNWGEIVTLYGTLMAICPSPIVALNRAIAVAQYEGAERGLAELHAMPQPERLERYPFYHAAIGEMELRCGRFARAAESFQAAIAAARNPTERRFLKERFSACGTHGAGKPRASI